MKLGPLAMLLAATFVGALPACSSSTSGTPDLPASAQATSDQACALVALCRSGSPHCNTPTGLVASEWPPCNVLCPSALGCVVDPAYAAAYDADANDAGAAADGGSPCPADPGTVTVQCEYGG